MSCYRQSDFIDFCTGPHLPHTGKIPAIKLLHTAAAHWRGREDAPMMQRIYGTAFFTPDDLQAFLDHLKEAQKRDHRRLGVALDLFHFDETAGPGMAFWHPKGGMVRHQIETYPARRANRARLRRGVHATHRQVAPVENLRALRLLPRQHVHLAGGRARIRAEADEFAPGTS